MALTPAQYPALKALIAGDSTLNALPNNGDSAMQIVDALDVVASPDFWVWRTNVTRADIYHTTSVDGTTWNWLTYKNQSLSEQGCWVQMFMGDQANFALPNLRAGVAVIFSGSGVQLTQQTHILTIGRRKATRAEKALATGTGSTAAPAVMGSEGRLDPSDIVLARNS